MDAHYCPYCNRFLPRGMTDEHVIPKSIGGDSRTIIRVCRRCNSTLGRMVDRGLSSDSWMRMNALFAGGIAKRQDRLKSTVTLKTGQVIEGYYYFTRTSEGVLPEFEPNKQQPDGTLWLSESARAGHALPPGFHMFSRDMVENWGYEFPPAKSSGMERAMLKVLLGIIYMDQGRSVVATPAFDVIRSSLSGTLHPDIRCTWLDAPMRWGDSWVRNHEHAVYFECAEGDALCAGVALYGTGILFEVRPFNCVIPKRCVRWDGRP